MPSSIRETATKPAHDDVVWRPRAAIEAGEVNRYSRFVGAMRLALPATAVLLLLLVLLVPQFRGGDDNFKVGEGALTSAAIDALSMTNARYSGTDANGQPYSVTAKSVRERTGTDKRVDLVGPQADVTLESGTWLSVSAETGLYDRDGDVLDLTGTVSLFQDQGYELHTAAATVHLKDGVASSRSAVDGQGPFGQLSAAGFDLYDKGRIVQFTGPARLVLNSSQDSPKGPASP